jgi:hypothetical protein
MALRTVHVNVPNPVGPFSTALVKGDYCYYHYGVDSVHDEVKDPIVCYRVIMLM